MGDTLSVTIMGRPPTPNARFGNRYAQAAEVKAWRRTARMVGIMARHEADWTAPPRAIITLIFTVPDRRGRDIDNLFGSTKPLTDGLVDAGVLVGDRSDVLSWRAPEIRIVKGVRSTEYVIEARP